METLQALPANDQAAGCIEHTQEKAMSFACLKTLTVAKQDVKLARM